MCGEGGERRGGGLRAGLTRSEGENVWTSGPGSRRVVCLAELSSEDNQSERNRQILLCAAALAPLEHGRRQRAAHAGYMRAAKPWVLLLAAVVCTGSLAFAMATESSVRKVRLELSVALQVVWVPQCSTPALSCEGVLREEQYYFPGGTEGR